MTQEFPPNKDLAWQTGLATLLGAIAFYTCLPVPQSWPLRFEGIARWAAIVGLGIGGLLGLLDWGLWALGMPVLTRSALIVVVWLAVTGGLHLDGAMDSADGLAVLDPQRRLEVMADSRAGAFGVMAAVVILLLKTVALTGIPSDYRCFALLGCAGWGRWGQLIAIVRYPYLRPQGKGAFHKAAISSLWEGIPSLLLLLGLSGLQIGWHPEMWWIGAGMGLGGGTLALGSAAYFNHRLGGHTGDTYGAVVEWTEALLLCGLTCLS